MAGAASAGGQEPLAIQHDGVEFIMRVFGEERDIGVLGKKYSLNLKWGEEK